MTSDRSVTHQKIIDFHETKKSHTVIRRFLPSGFCSETVFLVLTASCEISYLTLNTEKCFEFKF
jgi:hypothetical protein